LLYERIIFSGLSSGLISAYQYSRSLHDIPYFLIVMTIQTSLWPAFLEAVNSGNTDQIYQMTVKKLKLLFIIFLLISVQIYFFSEYILYLLFYRGAFGIDSLNLTSITLKVVIIGLLPLSILTLLGRALYAFKAIKWISLSGIFGTIVGLMFLYLGHYKQDIDWALYHFPASQISILFITGLGFLYYTKKIKSYKFWKSLILWFFKISCVFSIILSLYPFPDFDFKDKWELFFEILIHATSSSSLIFIMLFCFGIINFKQSIKKFKSIKFIHFN